MIAQGTADRSSAHSYRYLNVSTGTSAAKVSQEPPLQNVVAPPAVIAGATGGDLPLSVFC